MVDVPSSAPEGPHEAAPLAAGGVSPARRRRSVLPVLAIVAAFLAAVGGVVGFVVYDRATAIDRSTPAVAADQFIAAALIDRDTTRAQLFACDRLNVGEFVTGLPTFLQPIGISWGITSVVTTQHGAEVLARVRYTAVGKTVAADFTEHWAMTVVKSDGWRVCAVERQPSLDP